MSRPRILLADDHPPFMAAVGRLLAQHDCDVVGSVGDGARLIEEAARLQPDVIVLDLNMPGMNGLDACRELTRTTPRPTIIVLTAENDADVTAAVLAAGASALVDKQAVSTDLPRAVSVAWAGPRT